MIIWKNNTSLLTLYKRQYTEWLIDTKWHDGKKSFLSFLLWYYMEGSEKGILLYYNDKLIQNSMQNGSKKK